MVDSRILKALLAYCGGFWAVVDAAGDRNIQIERSFEEGICNLWK